MCASRLRRGRGRSHGRIPIASVGVLLPISSFFVARVERSETWEQQPGCRVAPSRLHSFANRTSRRTKGRHHPCFVFAIRLRASRDSVCIARALSRAARTIIYYFSRTRCSDQKRVHARLRRANGDAPQIRDRSKLRVREGPGSAAHHCMLRRAWDTRGKMRRENACIHSLPCKRGDRPKLA